MNSGEEDNIDSDDPDNVAFLMDVDEMVPEESSDFEIEIGDIGEDDADFDDNSDNDSDYEDVSENSDDTSSGGEPYVISSENEDSPRSPSPSPSSLSPDRITAALEIVNNAASMINEEECQSAQEIFSTETTNDNNDIQEEVFSCTICLESLTNTGEHRPACLKCGHIFGEKCIERWIKVGCNNEARRCPTCNTKASLKDIRILYAKHLTVVDTAEVTALEIRLDLVQREKNKVLAEFDKYKVKNEALLAENERLKSIVENSKCGLPTTIGPNTYRKCIKKINICKQPGCRVMTFNKNNMLLVVGQQSDSQLFTNSHLIRKLNVTILEPSNECIYAHTKQIRDMKFHPNEFNLLATVSLDKHLKLIDMGSNTVVSYLDVNEPLWSCCWAGDDPNILVAGGQMGSLFYVDRRFMKLLDSQQGQKFACVSLTSLPPSTSRSFINGGFLKTKMNDISILEHDMEPDTPKYKSTLLPLNGLWSSCSYNSQYNLLLTSSKPCRGNNSVRHIVSTIPDYNTEGPSINPVATFYGGDKATQLFRSCIVPPNVYGEDTLVCSFDEKSRSVKLFSIDSGNNVYNYLINENILDLCPFNDVVLNGSRAVAGLSENTISIFAV